MSEDGVEAGPNEKRLGLVRGAVGRWSDRLTSPSRRKSRPNKGGQIGSAFPSSQYSNLQADPSLRNEPFWGDEMSADSRELGVSADAARAARIDVSRYKSMPLLPTSLELAPVTKRRPPTNTGTLPRKLSLRRKKKKNPAREDAVLPVGDVHKLPAFHDPILDGVGEPPAETAHLQLPQGNEHRDKANPSQDYSSEHPTRQNYYKTCFSQGDSDEDIEAIPKDVTSVHNREHVSGLPLPPSLGESNKDRKDALKAVKHKKGFTLKRSESLSAFPSDAIQKQKKDNNFWGSSKKQLTRWSSFRQSKRKLGPFIEEEYDSPVNEGAPGDGTVQLGHLGDKDDQNGGFEVQDLDGGDMQQPGQSSQVGGNHAFLPITDASRQDRWVDTPPSKQGTGTDSWQGPEPESMDCEEEAFPPPELKSSGKPSERGRAERFVRAGKKQFVRLGSFRRSSKRKSSDASEDGENSAFGNPHPTFSYDNEDHTRGREVPQMQNSTVTTRLGQSVGGTPHSLVEVEDDADGSSILVSEKTVPAGKQVPYVGETNGEDGPTGDESQEPEVASMERLRGEDSSLQDDPQISKSSERGMAGKFVRSSKKHFIRMGSLRRSSKKTLEASKVGSGVVSGDHVEKSSCPPQQSHTACNHGKGSDIEEGRNFLAEGGCRTKVSEQLLESSEQNSDQVSAQSCPSMNSSTKQVSRLSNKVGNAQERNSGNTPADSVNVNISSGVSSSASGKKHLIRLGSFRRSNKKRSESSNDQSCSETSTGREFNSSEQRPSSGECGLPRSPQSPKNTQDSPTHSTRESKASQSKQADHEGTPSIREYSTNNCSIPKSPDEAKLQSTEVGELGRRTLSNSSFRGSSQRIAFNSPGKKKSGVPKQLDVGGLMLYSSSIELRSPDKEGEKQRTLMGGVVKHLGLKRVPSFRDKDKVAPGSPDEKNAGRGEMESLQEDSTGHGKKCELAGCSEPATPGHGGRQTSAEDSRSSTVGTPSPVVTKKSEETAQTVGNPSVAPPLTEASVNTEPRMPPKPLQRSFTLPRVSSSKLPMFAKSLTPTKSKKMPKSVGEEKGLDRSSDAKKRLSFGQTSRDAPVSKLDQPASGKRSSEKSSQKKPSNIARLQTPAKPLRKSTSAALLNASSPVKPSVRTKSLTPNDSPSRTKYFTPSGASPLLKSPVLKEPRTPTKSVRESKLAKPSRITSPTKSGDALTKRPTPTRSPSKWESKNSKASSAMIASVPIAPFIPTTLSQKSKSPNPTKGSPSSKHALLTKPTPTKSQSKSPPLSPTKASPSPVNSPVTKSLSRLQSSAVQKTSSLTKYPPPTKPNTPTKLQGKSKSDADVGGLEQSTAKNAKRRLLFGKESGKAPASSKPVPSTKSQSLAASLRRSESYGGKQGGESSLVKGSKKRLSFKQESKASKQTSSSSAPVTPTKPQTTAVSLQTSRGRGRRVERPLIVGAKETPSSKQEIKKKLASSPTKPVSPAKPPTQTALAHKSTTDKTGKMVQSSFLRSARKRLSFNQKTSDGALPERTSGGRTSFNAGRVPGNEEMKFGTNSPTKSGLSKESLTPSSGRKSLKNTLDDMSLDVSEAAGSRHHGVNIAPSTESQTRARYYSHRIQPSGALTREWRSTKADLDRTVGTASTSLLTDGLWYSMDQLHQRKASYLRLNRSVSSPFLMNCCPGCQAPFVSSSSKMRLKKAAIPNHCRMCSNVYCKKCLKYSRRLDKQGNYDPTGTEYMVCKNCHRPDMSEVTELGIIRSHMRDFNRYRDDFRKYQWDIEKAHEKYRFEPTPYSILRQCKRLREGYLGSLRDRSLALNIRKGPTPEWQKPRTWVEPSNKDVPGCQLCSKNLAKFVPGSLHNCRTCGRRVCNQDSSMDLMLYIPDGGTVENSVSTQPECRLIRIAGCPSTEPSIHLYLRICSTCKTKLTTLQERQYTQTASMMTRDYHRCVEDMEKIHQETKKMKADIQRRMPEYTYPADKMTRDYYHCLEGMEENATEFAEMLDKLVTDSKNLPEAVRKTLATHQGNLIDQFPQYLTAVSKLRELSPQTDQQVKLVRHIKQEKVAFYQESSAQFQRMVRQMMDFMPRGEIEQIRRTVDTDAINCTCLVLKQLALEVLKISIVNRLPEELALSIKAVYTQCEEDLKQLMREAPAEDNWGHHLDTITQYVKGEMESGRRFIRVERKGENVSLEVFVRKECARKVEDTLLQLQLKSSGRSFTEVKDALEQLQEECS